MSELAMRVPADHVWPVASPRMLALARFEVDDLTRDPQLLEMLAAVCERAAAKEWAASVRGARTADARS